MNNTLNTMLKAFSRTVIRSIILVITGVAFWGNSFCAEEYTVQKLFQELAQESVQEFAQELATERKQEHVSPEYSPELDHWLSYYLSALSDHQVHLLLTILYLSWLRSWANQETQKQVAQLGDSAAAVRNYFNAVRLDPAQYTTILKNKSTDEHVSPEQSTTGWVPPEGLRVLFDEQWQRTKELLEQHERIGIIYDNLVKQFVDKNGFNDTRAHEALLTVRKATRLAVLKKTVLLLQDDENTQAGWWTLVKNGLSTLVSTTGVFSHEFWTTQTNSARSLQNHFFSVLTKGFYQSEQEYATILATAVKLVSDAFKRHDCWWEHWETVRQEIYRRYYQAVYEQLLSRRVPTAAYCLACDDSTINQSACRALLARELTPDYFINKIERV